VSGDLAKAKDPVLRGNHRAEEDNMGTSKLRATKFGSIFGRILAMLVVTAMITGVTAIPSAGDDRRDGYRDHRRYERGWREHRPPRYYPAPVYAPPPVVYSPYPYQSPGITLVFPFHIR